MTSIYTQSISRGVNGSHDYRAALDAAIREYEELGAKRRELDARLSALAQTIDDEPNKEIAAQLDLAEDTVKRHVTNILSKLGANDRTHAVTIGLKRGIIELQ